MSEALHPFTTAGVALVGAGLIAVTPVATPLPTTLALHDVELTSISDIFQDASENYSGLVSAFANANQAVVDAIQGNPDWFSALTANPEQLYGALTFMAGDQKGFLNELAGNTLGLPVQTDPSAEATSFGGWLLYALLTNQGGDLAPGLFPEIPAPIPDVAQVLSSPLSEVFLGAVSPMIAPMVPFLNPFMELIADFENGTTPDYGQLATELLQAPLNSINAFLNGDTLDLDPLLPLVNGAGLLPEGDSITGLSFAFGGLLSPGEVGGNAGALSESGPFEPVLGGGSVLNALGIDLNVTDPLTLTLPFVGEGVGPFGALIGLEQIFADLFSGNLDFAGTDPAPDAAADAASSLAGSDFLSFLGL